MVIARANLRIIPFRNEDIPCLRAHILFLFLSKTENIRNAITIGKQEFRLSELIKEWMAHSLV